MKQFPEGVRRHVPMDTTKATNTDQAKQVGKARKLETPAEFYKRVTQNPGVRDLLSRLAKK